MNIFNKTLTMSGTGAKAPVKIAIKTNYRITIMVNDNTVILGTHAGMLLIGPNTFEIYDPNGSFHYPGISGGSLGLVPVDDLGKQHDVFKKYLEYQLINGESLFVFILCI